MDGHSVGALRESQFLLPSLYRIIDALLIISLLLTACIVHGEQWSEYYLTAAAGSIALFFLFAENLNIYRSWRGVPINQYLQPVLLNWTVTVGLLITVIYGTGYDAFYSWEAMLTWLLATPIAFCVWRLTLRMILGYFRSRGFNTRRVAIVGLTSQGAMLADVILSEPSLGMELTGFFDDRCQSTGRTEENISSSIIGNTESLVTHIKAHKVDLVYIAIPMRGETRIEIFLQTLSDTTASVYIVPDFFTHDLMNSRLINLGPVPTISIFETPFLGVSAWVKRLEDILVATAALIITAIPMLCIATGIKLTSPGPVIFRQRRYGLDGKQIEVLKFRSMNVCNDGDQVVQASKNDARVTRFGAFLRRNSLDELPQFFNVLIGEMSIVGPRPHAVAHNEEYRGLISGYMLRHKVKPGITGWAQINGYRGETKTLDKMQKRIEYDLWYIRSWSILLDLKIIFKTIINGFRGQNAY